MKRGWQAAGACFFLLFGFALTESLSLPLQDALGPGPGFFPLCLAILGMVLSAGVVAQVSVSGQAAFAEPLQRPSRSAALRVVAVLAGLAAAAALIDWLGFRAVAFAFCLLLLPATGARHPLAILAFAAVAGFGVFHVFYYWLKVPLPIGAFGW